MCWSALGFHELFLWSFVLNFRLKIISRHLKCCYRHISFLTFLKFVIHFLLASFFHFVFLFVRLTLLCYF